MNWITAAELSERFDGFLFDAYGVLVDSDRVLPGADAFLRRLRAMGKPFRIISNDASSTPESKVERWGERGLYLEVERLITPWQVLASHDTPLSLRGLNCLVIGTPQSRLMLERAGGRITEDPYNLDALLIADEMEPDVWRHCDKALSVLVKALHLGREPRLVLVNPDLIYPSFHGFGFTSGAIALMFEAALKRLFARDFPFMPVGKPEPYLYHMGLGSLGLRPERVAMIGDQLETDVRGALRSGLNAVLIGTGVTPLNEETLRREPRALHLASFAPPE